MLARMALLLYATLAVVTSGPLAAADEAAYGTDPTMGSTELTTTGTGTGTGTDSDSGVVTDTSTMPPEFEPCGCRSAGEGGAWAVLALLFTVGSPYRRRRPTTRCSCCRAA
jgi:hypothetical protein